MTLASPAARQANDAPSAPSPTPEEPRSQRHELIEANLSLVGYVVSRMTNMLAASGIDQEDAYSYGVEGLIQAIDNYDTDRDTTLGTFALLRVRGSILDAIRRNDLLSRNLRRRLREVENSNLELANSLGRWPTMEE